MDPTLPSLAIAPPHRHDHNRATPSCPLPPTTTAAFARIWDCVVDPVPHLKVRCDQVTHRDLRQKQAYLHSLHLQTVGGAAHYGPSLPAPALAHRYDFCRAKLLPSTPPPHRHQDQSEFKDCHWDWRLSYSPPIPLASLSLVQKRS